MEERILEAAEAHARSEILAGITRIQGRIQKQPVDFDGKCEDCEADIPAERLQHGVTTCIHCQMVRERHASQRSARNRW